MRWCSSEGGLDDPPPDLLSSRREDDEGEEGEKRSGDDDGGATLLLRGRGFFPQIELGHGCSPFFCIKHYCEKKICQ